MKRQTVFFWAAALSLGQAMAQSDQEKELDVNAQFYHLDLELALDKPFVKGSVDSRFLCTKEGATEFEMDLSQAFKVTKVEGSSAFEQRGDRLWIKVPSALKNQQIFNVKVFYEGTPPAEKVNGAERGMLFKKHGDKGETIIATACYPQYGHLWFPCIQRAIDKADSIYVDITIPDQKTEVEMMNPQTQQLTKQSIPYIAVSNGTLAKTDKADGKKTYRWRHRYRIAPQHVLVAVSNFAKISTEYKDRNYKLPIDFYVLPEKYDEAQPMVNRIPEIMACLSGTFGDYPFRNERFAVTQVGFPLGGDGLPTQANVLMESLKSTQISALVHQVANMWFGNHISPKTPQDAWITEGLASYAEAMWQEYKRGLVAVDITMTEKKQYLEAGKLAGNTQEKYLVDMLAKRGAYVIHMLRGVMGDAYFFEALKGITSLKKMRGEHSKTYITTADFQRICQYYASENEEQDYTYFFDQWVRGELFPVYTVEYSVGKKGELLVKVKQDQRSTTPDYFKMPAKLKITLADSTTKLESVVHSGAEQTYTYNYGQGVIDVKFDPMGWIFKELRYTHALLNTKTPLTNLVINTENNGRTVNLQFMSEKKQDVILELTELDPDGKPLKPQTQTITGATGEVKQTLKIPLDSKSRAIYILRVIGKSDIYTKELRLNRVEDLF